MAAKERKIRKIKIPHGDFAACLPFCGYDKPGSPVEFQPAPVQVSTSQYKSVQVNTTSQIFYMRQAGDQATVGSTAWADAEESYRRHRWALKIGLNRTKSE
jgi:hypothetical protein